MPNQLLAGPASQSYKVPTIMLLYYFKHNNMEHKT